MAIFNKDILIPNDNINFSKWSVIACDQFTSNKDYWNELKSYIGNSPSTLNFIIPESFINHASESTCCNNINNAIKNNCFKTLKNSSILICRQTPYHSKRIGLVTSIDLEDYSFSKETKSLIRPSEGILWERIVPRIAVRENSLIEFPHIILLYDDRDFNILENLYSKRNDLNKIYDFNLSGNGGHITGYEVNENLDNEFQKLLDKNYLKKTFNTDEKLLFIVGDGNHSLATAKTCWENLKKNLSEEEKINHPARFCLVEICNINDDGIEFYPIHRVIFNYTDEILNGIKNLYTKSDKVGYKLCYNGKYDEYFLPPNTPQAINLLQTYIEKCIKGKKITVDYIHDTENVLSVCKEKNLGIFLPVIEKKDIFEYVIKNGVLPKKSFSIGKSIEKRYYLEGKYIKLQ